MSHIRDVTVILFVILGTLLLGCSGAEITEKRDNIPASYVDADGSHASAILDTLRNPFPHLLMEDGSITINDRCPVRKAALNRRLPTLFVNGKPLGFC